MVLMSIALTWMLLAAIVVGLCRAARLGDSSREPAGGSGARPVAARTSAPVVPQRPESGLRRRGRPLRGGDAHRAFTKSLRRRVGLRRA
jgi:hypothetical protein